MREQKRNSFRCHPSNLFNLADWYNRNRDSEYVRVNRWTSLLTFSPSKKRRQTAIENQREQNVRHFTRKLFEKPYLTIFGSPHYNCSSWWNNTRHNGNYRELINGDTGVARPDLRTTRCCLKKFKKSHRIRETRQVIYQNSKGSYLWSYALSHFKYISVGGPSNAISTLSFPQTVELLHRPY